MHCWLARRCDAHIAGGFLGDFVKGRIPRTLPENFQQGLRLHRFVDRISNQLPELRVTYWRFGSSLRRMAPTFLDLIADHLLAKHWPQHGSGELCTFTSRCYRIIGTYPMSESAQQAHQRLVKLDLWKTYQDFDTILTIMKRMLVRLRMDECAPELDLLTPQLEGFYMDFLQYYPVLTQHHDQWLHEHCPDLRMSDKSNPTARS